MGIRVHKVLGYGLDDMQTKDYQITDERINELGFLGLYTNYEDQENIWSTKLFYHFWENHIKENMFTDLYLSKMLFQDTDRQYPELYSCILHNSEFALPEVLLIVPLSMHFEWYRYDDNIDYHEETEIYNQKNRIIKLPWGIYPWNALFIKSDGTRYTGIEASYVREFMRNQISIMRKLEEDNMQTHFQERKEYFAKKLGFNSAEDAEKEIRPMIPEEVIMLCKYLNLFNDEKTIYDLYPIMYVYWS